MGANVSVGISLSFYLPRLLDLYYTLNKQRSFIFVFLCRFLSVEGNFIHRLLSGHRGGSATTLKERGALECTLIDCKKEKVKEAALL